MPRGYWPSRRNWTTGEIALLRAAYECEYVGLAALAANLRRSEANVSRKARSLGLTKRGRPMPAGAREMIGARMAASIAAVGHPRGMKGKVHTEAAREKMRRAANHNVTLGLHPGQQPRDSKYRRAMSVAASKRLRSLSQPYSRCHQGRRPDLENQYFRSAWEANYARYLNLCIQSGRFQAWKYESTTFRFDGIRRGTMSYTPDFKVTRRDGGIEYHEVKGWMDRKSKTRLRRMRRYHPTITVVLVDRHAYNDIARKLAGAIPGWEF